MGKKVSPVSLRVGITRTWDSRWWAGFGQRGSGKSFSHQLLQDLEIRKLLHQKLAPAGVSKVEIERSAAKITVIVHAAKPGMIVGRGGDEINKLSKALQHQHGEMFDIKVQEVRKPDADANLIAKNVAEQIAKRFPFRRVMKMAAQRAQESGAKGVKILVSGRLNGVDIARKEKVVLGTVPLHTLRANIEYAEASAPTTYGTIGVKVWIYHGLVFRNEALNTEF